MFSDFFSKVLGFGVFGICFFFENISVFFLEKNATRKAVKIFEIYLHFYDSSGFCTTVFYPKSPESVLDGFYPKSLKKKCVGCFYPKSSEKIYWVFLSKSTGKMCWMFFIQNHWGKYVGCFYPKSLKKWVGCFYTKFPRKIYCIPFTRNNIQIRVPSVLGIPIC